MKWLVEVQVADNEDGDNFRTHTVEVETADGHEALRLGEMKVVNMEIANGQKVGWVEPLEARPLRRGMLVHLIRAVDYDGPPDQWTNRFRKFVVTHPDLPEIFTPTGDAPELELQPGPGRRRWIVVPKGRPSHRKTIGPMFGGHYVGTSDSRWMDLIGDPGVVPVHDRWETPETYERLSQ
jgi:hypothetical protein